MATSARRNTAAGRSTRSLGRGAPHSASTSRARTPAKPSRRVRAMAGIQSLAGPRSEYRIYPSIGIARVGNSKDGFFLGPEAPGVVPEGPFRGADGIKPQGARFRIYRVDIDSNE